MTVGLQRLLQLAVVLDDAVQHDRQPAVVAAGERVGVLLVDGAMRRPASVAEAMAGARAVGARCVLQKLQVADRADVVQSVGLAQRDPGGVVAAVLEPLQPSEEQRLRFTRPDVSDDPAHLKLLSVAGAVFADHPAPETRKPG